MGLINCNHALISAKVEKVRFFPCSLYKYLSVLQVLCISLPIFPIKIKHRISTISTYLINSIGYPHQNLYQRSTKFPKSLPVPRVGVS